MVSLMLKDINFAEKCSRYVESSLLYSDGLQWIFETIKSQVNTEGTVPTDIELEDKLKYVDPSRRKLVASFIEQIQEIEIKSTEFIKKKLTDYARRIKYNEIFRDAQVEYNAGNTGKAYDITNIGMSELYSITFNDDEIVDGGDLEKVRMTYIKQSILSGTRFVPTMIEELDQILGGGLEKGRLGVLLAEPKKGKSVGLVHMGCAAVLMRLFKVAHFVLEGTTEETVMRYESRLSGVPYKKIYHDELLPEEEERIQNIDRLTKGRLEIIPMNKHWEYSTADIEGKIIELKRRGFEPDLVIIDYADLLKGRGSFRAGEKRHEQTEVYRDCKKIAMVNKCALWTASQAVRPSDAPEKEYLLRAKDISESYEKVRIADFVATLNSTVREMNLGILRFHADIYRNSDCNKTIRLITNFSKMIFSSKRYPSADMPEWKKKFKKKGKR